MRRDLRMYVLNFWSQTMHELTTVERDELAKSLAARKQVMRDEINAGLAGLRPCNLNAFPVRSLIQRSRLYLHCNTEDLSSQVRLALPANIGAARVRGSRAAD